MEVLNSFLGALEIFTSFSSLHWLLIFSSFENKHNGFECVLFAPQTRKKSNLSCSPAPKDSTRGLRALHCQTPENQVLAIPNLGKWKCATRVFQRAISLIIPEPFCRHSTTVCRELKGLETSFFIWPEVAQSSIGSRKRMLLHN